MIKKNLPDCNTKLYLSERKKRLGLDKDNCQQQFQMCFFGDINQY